MANKTAIVTVVCNTSALISKQVECIRKYCKDEYDIIVVDNSNNKDAIEAIRYYCTQLNVEYLKTFSAESSGSRSNAFACNLAYQKLRERYDYFLFLDHDTFPIRDFSIVKELDGHVMSGLGQTKSKTYFQQTSLMWNNTTIDQSLIDFSCNNELGLDTGGNLYKLVELYGADAFVFFNEKYYQNPYFREGFYNFYATVNNDMFMHFINGSGWNPTPKNEERINSLINVLNERISTDEGGTYPPVY
jgi:hypothetical protein